MYDWIQQCDRRDFLRWAGEFIVAMHLPAMGRAPAQISSADAKASEPRVTARFSHLRLQTYCLGELRTFYSKTIGPLQGSDGGGWHGRLPLRVPPLCQRCFRGRPRASMALKHRG